MPLYLKPSQDEVYDLINQANPTLGFVASPLNVKLSAPTAATVSGQPNLNTKTTLSAVQGGDFMGRKDVFYRRRSLTSLFRGITVQIDLYRAPVSAGTVAYTVYQLLPYINAKYGMSLTQDDIIDGNILYGSTLEGGFNTTTITVTAKPTSLGYIGTFALKWKSAPQDLATMIGVSELGGRLYPGGNDFTSHKNIVNFMGYATDWTTFLGTYPYTGYPNATSLAASNTVQNIAWANQMLAELNRQYGTTFPTNLGGSTLLCKTAVVYSLPSPLVPEANSRYFNRVLVVDINDVQADAIGVGRFYHHFNV